MANATCVAVSHEGPVTVLSMQFEPHNLLGPDLMAGMREGLKSATENGSRAILLKSGLRHFSAGADTSLFAAALGDAGQLSVSPLDFLRELESFPLPMVAAVKGVCVGGGLELALACDLILAARSSKVRLSGSNTRPQPFDGSSAKTSATRRHCSCKRDVYVGSSL